MCVHTRALFRSRDQTVVQWDAGTAISAAVLASGSHASKLVRRSRYHAMVRWKLILHRLQYG